MCLCISVCIFLDMVDEWTILLCSSVGVKCELVRIFEPSIGVNVVSLGS